MASRSRMAVSVACVCAALIALSSSALAGAWYLNDSHPAWTWGVTDQYGALSHVEAMDPGCLSACVFDFLDPDTNYVAFTMEPLGEHYNEDFGATLFMHNAQSGKSYPVVCTLWVSQNGGINWCQVGCDTVRVTHDGFPPPASGPIAHRFDFGTMSYHTAGEALQLVIDYGGQSGDTAATHLYWDGSSAGCNSAVYSGLSTAPEDLVVCEYQAGGQPPHPGAYWYDVTPVQPRRDFHVRVYDDDSSHYSGWQEPPGWVHTLHQVGCEWWVSWYAPSAADTLAPFNLYRFQFTNQSEKAWSRWTTTNSGSSNPHVSVADSTEAHVAQDGYGKRVHVPKKPDDAGITPITPFDPGRFKGDAKFAEFPGAVPVLVISGENDAGLGTVVYSGETGEMVFRQQLTSVFSEGSGNLAWGDYDADGWPDLAQAGESVMGPVTHIYHNVLGTFELVAASPEDLTALSYASLAWGDWDLDGRDELLAMGHDGVAARCDIYDWEWVGSDHFYVSEQLPGLYAGSADWADWDGDGDPDLLVTGSDGVLRQTIFYMNDPVGTLVSAGNLGLPDVALSDAEWGDCDADGDLDLAFTGEANVDLRVSRVYRNDGGALTLTADLLNIYRSSCAWGDADLDGDLDVAFCGYDGASLLTRLYLNTASGFVNSGVSLPGVREGALVFGDIDGDCDPDLLVVGADWSHKYSRPYENDLLYVAGVPDGGSGGDMPRGLVAGYPNPFGPETSIRWMLPESGTVTVGIYDLAGRLVRAFGPMRLEAGEQELAWDGLRADGRAVPSGVYFCKVQAPGLDATHKLVLLK